MGNCNVQNCFIHPNSLTVSTEILKDLSQFQRKSANAPQKELPKRKLEWKFMKITEMIISVFIYIK